MSNPYARVQGSEHLAATDHERVLRRLQEAGECVVWTGATYTGHHGSIRYGRIKVAGGKWKAVHRIMFEAEVRKLEPDEEVGRRCRNTLCCKASHMFAFNKKTLKRAGDTP